MDGKMRTPAVASDPDRELVKAIAMDIGKEVVAYVEVMYPKAIEATTSGFPLSLQNCIYNEIMAALDVNDQGQIIARLGARKKFRRWWVNANRRVRRQDAEAVPIYIPSPLRLR